MQGFYYPNSIEVGWQKSWVMKKKKEKQKKKTKKNVEMRSNLTMVFFKTKFYHCELVAKIMNPNKSWNLVDHVWHWIYHTHTHIWKIK